MPADPTPTTAPTDVPTTAASMPTSTSYPTTKTGAYAIAKDILEVGATAGETGDLTHYKTLATPDCTCIAQTMKYFSQYTGKGTLSGGQPGNFKLIAYTRVTPGLAQIFITYDAAVTVLKDAQGKVLGKSAAVHGKEDGLTLRAVSGAWLVTSIAPLTKGES